MSTPELRAELEKKKARLAALKEEKQRRENQRRQQLLEGAGAEGRGISPGRLSDIPDVDRLLEEVGHTVSSYSPSDETKANKEAVSSQDGSPTHTVLRSRVGRISLQKADVIQVNFPPKEQVNYNKTTQTTIEAIDPSQALHSFEWDDEFSPGQLAGAAASPSEEVFDLEGSLSTLPRLPQIGVIGPAEVPAEKHEKLKIPELTEEERQQILTSDEFVRSFDRTARVLERALTEDVDKLFLDYAIGPEDQEKVDTGAKLHMNRAFFDEKWCKGRCVTCMDYNPQHPELVAVSYSNNEDAAHDPDGVVVIWNAKFKKNTPEYVFHCQSRVVSTAFAKFHPNLIFGGTYSGQVCLWDNRQNKRTPVQRTPLQSTAHTHPVYCLSVVGTQNAHNLVSISTDGKLCSWSLDMLSQPQDTLELQLKQSKQVAATCISFPSSDVNNFVLGAEDGSIYAASRHGSKQGINEVYEGHFGPVTGIDCHKAQGQVDFSHLFVSSSFDWTVKLWSMKELKSLYSFEDHQDYVMDVAWSPIHPALFACVDATGRLDLWNLNQDTEVPAASLFVDGRPALNKLMWMQNGLQLCVGDGAGQVWLFDVHESLANPRADEWTKLARTLMDLQQSNAEVDESAQALPSVAVTGSSPMR